MKMNEVIIKLKYGNQTMFPNTLTLAPRPLCLYTNKVKKKKEKRQLAEFTALKLRLYILIIKTYLFP